MPAYTLVVTADKIQVLGESGTYSELPLPDGVYFTGQPARVARLRNRLVVTGAVTVPIWIGNDLIARVLALPTPSNPPSLASGGAGSYTGTRRCKVSFIVRATDGSVVAESPLSTESAAVAFANQIVSISNIPVPPSTSPVTDRRIYLTTDLGATYFHAFDIAGTTATTALTTISDAALSLASSPDNLVQAPSDLDLPTVWKNRMWGKSGDSLVGTASGFIDRWPNAFPVDQGTDSFGITGLIPRRDEMAVGRRNKVYRLTGDNEASFALPILVEGIGIIAPGTCCVIKDVGYWLGDDGVYIWNSEGTPSITDDTVRPWFTTDDFFNRALFSEAFACYDPARNRYVLFLASAGSDDVDSWVEYDVEMKKWFGPHTTAMSVVFKSAFVGPDADNNLRLIAAGDDGFLYALTPGVYTDGPSNDQIALRVLGKFHFGQSPDLFHVFGQPSFFVKKESGKTLVVNAHVGEDTDTAITYTENKDMGEERSKLPRLGAGRLCQIELTQAAGGAETAIYGYQFPWATLGRR